MPDGGPPQASDGGFVWFTFGGPTALVRAHQLLRAGGQRCAITAAPAGHSPCGLALAVPRDASEAALLVLRGLRATPQAVVDLQPERHD